MQLALDAGDQTDPRRRIVQGAARLGFGRGALHAQQSGHNLDIVGHPVLQFAKQQVAALGQIGIALALDLQPIKRRPQAGYGRGAEPADDQEGEARQDGAGLIAWGEGRRRVGCIGGRCGGHRDDEGGAHAGEIGCGDDRGEKADVGIVFLKPVVAQLTQGQGQQETRRAHDVSGDPAFCKLSDRHDAPALCLDIPSRPGPRMVKPVVDPGQ